LSEDIYQALSRTALLLERDIFATADHRPIVDGLRATTARIIANRANTDSVAGQTALVTLYAQLAMMGLQVDLDIPTIDLVLGQPPLRGDDLEAALVDFSEDLPPGGSSRPAAVPDITFALGDTPALPTSVRVSGTAWQASVAQVGQAGAWRGTMPVGAMAAGAAAAADGLRVALPRIAERLERPTPVEAAFVLDPSRQVSVDLSDFSVSGPVRLGEVDVISGGAITNAALYALRRIPDVSARMRVLEPDALDLTNLNRYPVARRSQVGMLKAELLQTLSAEGFQVTGLPVRFDETTLPFIGALAPRVLVGVDHIPSRWCVQVAAYDRWVCVGASSHFYVLVSAHPIGRPCAGCVHPRDDSTLGNIPTISFVSFWAGLIQALEVLREVAGTPKAVTTSTNVWPLGLDGRRGIQAVTQSAVAECPTQCRASRARRRQIVGV